MDDLQNESIEERRPLSLLTPQQRIINYLCFHSFLFANINNADELCLSENPFHFNAIS